MADPTNPYAKYAPPPDGSGSSSSQSTDANPYAKYAPPPTDTPSAGAAAWTGFKHGLTNLFYGGAQLGTRMGPDEGGAAFADPAELEARKQTVDTTVKAREKAYADDPARKAHPVWGGVGNIGGELTSTLPLMAFPGSRALLAGPAVFKTLPARMAAAGPVGATFATAQPVADPEHYGSTKTEQIISGDIGGMIGEPIGEALVKVPGAIWRWGKGMLADAATKAATRETALKQKAADIIAGRVSEAQKSGRLKVGDAMNIVREAHAAGQTDYTLMDLDNPAGPLRRLGGTLHRGPGEAGGVMEDWQKGRTYGIDEDTQYSQQGKRLHQWIRDKLASGSAFLTGKILADQRSANAKPLFDQVRAGVGMQALEHRLGLELESARQTEAAAAQQLREAQTKLTGAMSRQQTSAVAQREAATTPAQASARELAGAGKTTLTGAAPPEDLSSEANQAVTVANNEVRAAEYQLQQARAVTESTRTRFQQAQADGTANAPGATWSPRLQQFFDDPIVKRGFGEAWRREQREAIAEGRPANPTDYAIVGFDEAGDPVVGKVPNMRAIMLAKQGMDMELLHGQGMYDQFGRKTDKFRVLDKFRRAYLQEVDRLNPHYEGARKQWADDTEMMQALRDGQAALKRPPTGPTTEEFKEDWGKMSAGEREMYKLGVADQMIENLDFARLSGDESRALINSRGTREKLRGMFDATPEGKEEFNKFIRFIERERNMWEMGTDVFRGSQTAGREAADQSQAGAALSAAAHATHGFGHLKVGNIPAAAAAFLRARRDLQTYGLRQDPKLNLEVARQLIDPAQTEAQLQRALTPPAPPPLTRTQRIGNYTGVVGGDIGALATPNLTYRAPPDFAPPR